MHEIACPHCRAAMQFVPEMAGTYVACPICRQAFVMPAGPRPEVPPTGYGVPATTNPYAESRRGYGQGYAQHGPYGPYPRYDWLAGVKVPILISGILNAVAAVIWLLTCLGIIFSVPLFILCVFEFSYYSNADKMPPPRAVHEGRTLGIWEIVVGVFTLNVISLICGILAMVNANQAQRELATMPL